MQFKWKLDFSKILQANEKAPDQKQVFTNIFDSALNSAYRDGLSRDYTRRSFNIINKVELSETEFIDLTEKEFELLEEAFDKAKMPSNLKKVLVQIYDNIEEIKNKKIKE
jgi:hypothetical protein